MARMSGLSLQSVRAMVPTISWRNSFSCMAKHVKLYICKEMRGAQTWTLSHWGHARLKAPSGWTRPTCAELGGRGVILHSSCLPGTISTLSAAGEEPSSRSSTAERQKQAPHWYHPHATEVTLTLENCCDWLVVSLKSIIPLWPFSPLSLSCCFSYELQKQWRLQRTGTPSTSHTEHTASFYCTTHTHTQGFLQRSFVMMLTGAAGALTLIKTSKNLCVEPQTFLQENQAP